MAAKTAKSNLPKRFLRKTAKASTSGQRAKPTATKADAQPITKLDAVVTALRRSKGATLAELMVLTGWQMHSVRGAIAGALKKKRGLAVLSTKTGAERVYRIESGR